MRTITDRYGCQVFSTVHHGDDGPGVTLRALEINGTRPGENKVVAVHLTPEQALDCARELVTNAEHAQQRATLVPVPIGILERAGNAADMHAEDLEWRSDGETANLLRMSAANDRLARALYAAARGEGVDWSQV